MLRSTYLIFDREEVHKLMLSTYTSRPLYFKKEVKFLRKY